MKNTCKVLILKVKTRKQIKQSKKVQTKQREKVKLNIPFNLGVFLKRCQQECYHSLLAPKNISILINQLFLIESCIIKRILTNAVASGELMDL